jgi:hypothetical protein
MKHLKHITILWAALLIALLPVRSAAQGWVPTPRGGGSGGIAGACGGDLTGTYPNCIVSTISGTAPVNIVNSTLTFGTSTAQSGDLRFPNGAIMMTMRNAANSGDLVALQSNSNNLLIGGSGSPSNIYETVASGGTLGFWTNTTEALSLDTSTNAGYTTFSSPSENFYFASAGIEYHDANTGFYVIGSNGIFLDGPLLIQDPGNGNMVWEWSDHYNLQATQTVAATAAGVLITQAATATLNATATDMTFAPQQSTNASSTSGKSGDVIFNVGAPPGSSTTEAFVRFQRAGSDEVWIGADPSAPSDVGIWFGSATPTGGNFSFLGNPSGGQVYLNASNYVFLTAGNAALELNTVDAAMEPALSTRLNIGAATNPFGPAVFGGAPSLTTYAGYYLFGAPIGDTTTGHYQAGVISRTRWFKVTSDTLTHTISSSMTSGDVYNLTIDWTCKSETTGAEYYGGRISNICVNVGGTSSCQTTGNIGTPQGTCIGTSACIPVCLAPTITAGGSGSFVLTFSEGSNSTGTYDWQFDVYSNNN